MFGQADGTGLVPALLFDENASCQLSKSIINYLQTGHLLKKDKEKSSYIFQTLSGTEFHLDLQKKNLPRLRSDFPTLNTYS